MLYWWTWRTGYFASVNSIKEAILRGNALYLSDNELRQIESLLPPTSHYVSLRAPDSLHPCSKEQATRNGMAVYLPSCYWRMFSCCVHETQTVILTSTPNIFPVSVFKIVKSRKLNEITQNKMLHNHCVLLEMCRQEREQVESRKLKENKKLTKNRYVGIITINSPWN